VVTGQWRSQPKISGEQKIWGAEMFDIRRARVFCLGPRFSEHKMTRYAKNIGGHCPLGPSGAYDGGKQYIVT